MAISVAITSIKIDITSTGGVQVPFSDVVTAVNANTAGTITGSGTDADPWVITATAYRELEISSGCKVLFESGTRINWQWSTTSGTYYILDMAAGSTVHIEEDVIFDLGSTGTYRRGYVYSRGSLIINGTLGNEVIFKNYRSMYIYPYNYDVTIDHCKFQNATYSNGYMVYVSYDQCSTAMAHFTMTNITVENTNGNYWGRVCMMYMSSPLINLYKELVF